MPLSQFIYFTAEIRNMIATKKPELLPDGSCLVIWQARGNEYSLAFKPERAAFVLDRLSKGAP